MFVWVHRDETLLAKHVTGFTFQPRYVVAHLIEVSVHAIEPMTDPAKAGFEKCHFQFWKLAQHTATDDIETRSLHFPGMTHHVKEEGVFVAFLSEGRHLGAEAAVNGDRYIQLLCFAPEYIICRITQPSAIEWIGAHEHRA